MIKVLLVAGVTILAFILSILFLPELSLGKKLKLKLYPLIPLLGGGIMLGIGGVHMGNIASAFTEASSVNPIRILILFFSMTVFSLILEQTGFFEHISGVILQKSGHNQYKIFLSLYAVISFLTIFTSNDIVILTFTPFICHFCKAAKIDPIPYLIMEFVAANTWSLFLLIGNPTNIYVSGAFDIGFVEYIRAMALPTVAAGLCSLLIMSVLFRKKLHGQIITITVIEPITNRPLMWVSLLHLVACVMLLSVSQYIGFEMWLVSFLMACSAVISATVCLCIQKKRLTPVGHAIRKMPFEIIPFIVGMFILVLALEESNVTYRISQFLQADHSVFSFGFLSFICSNIFNNIPMSVLFSKILGFEATLGQIYATIIGSNIGAFITPIGALAGIMWLNLLKQNKVKLSSGRFVILGTLIGVPAMIASLLVLQFMG